MIVVFEYMGKEHLFWLITSKDLQKLGKLKKNKICILSGRLTPLPLLEPVDPG